METVFKNMLFWGCLDGSDGWEAYSWFQLKSWSPLAPHPAFPSPSPSAPPPLSPHTVSKINEVLKKNAILKAQFYNHIVIFIPHYKAVK